MKRVKIQYVSIRFWDHAEDEGVRGAGPIEAEVVGILAKEDKLHYQVQSWVFDQNARHPQNKVFSILKGAVIGLRRLQ